MKPQGPASDIVFDDTGFKMLLLRHWILLWGSGILNNDEFPDRAAEGKAAGWIGSISGGSMSSPQLQAIETSRPLLCVPLCPRT